MIQGNGRNGPFQRALEKGSELEGMELSYLGSDQFIRGSSMALPLDPCLQ